MPKSKVLLVSRTKRKLNEKVLNLLKQQYQVRLKYISSSNSPLESRKVDCDIVVVIYDHIDSCDWAWYMTTMGQKVILISGVTMRHMPRVNPNNIENLLPKIKQMLWEKKHPAEKIEISFGIKKKPYTTTISLFFPKYKHKDNQISITAILLQQHLKRELDSQTLINIFPELEPIPRIVKNVLGGFQSYLNNEVEIITTNKNYDIVIIKCL